MYGYLEASRASARAQQGDQALGDHQVAEDALEVVGDFVAEAQDVVGQLEELEARSRLFPIVAERAVVRPPSAVLDLGQGAQVVQRVVALAAVAQAVQADVHVIQLEVVAGHLEAADELLMRERPEI